MESNRAKAGARATQIKQRALQVGFSGVGIVRVEELSAEREHLNEWLARGFHGEMKWMERDPHQRTDPRSIFPQARSVVVVTLNYYTAHQHEAGARRNQVRAAGGNGRVGVGTSDSDQIDQSPATGKISRYAWGDDYHDIVGGKLCELLAWIKQQWPEAEGKVCVDIQPTMDKAWAVRAGLGWMGKHTNVISEKHGSWIFIGELLLSLELAYHEMGVADQCGSCTLCIDACPTGAIVEPYVLDANRCISHATIESRVPEMRRDVAARLEGWLYGCDICQDVCPWNQMVSETDDVRFQPREGNLNANLSDILQLTPATYASRFRHSAMKRAKLSGFQRNARALLAAHRRDGN